MWKTIFSWGVNPCSPGYLRSKVVLKMYVAKVIGKVVCIHKDENLKGLKIMIVQPLDNHLVAKGVPHIAIDTIGQAGQGDLVYLAKSKESSLPLGKSLVPSDAGIMGIIDYYNIQNNGGNEK